MSDAVDRGITVIELAAMDEPIDVAPETTAAFVGRTLRGPLNEAVLVHDFGEFRRRFGDVWTRSSLGPAVQQFFDHGGRKLYVVRVANEARGALICLPANGSAVVLRAIEPGSTERIRAAVDFDGIDPASDELFNLTLQRLDPLTGLVADQELFPRSSYLATADNFIGDRLATSSLVRLAQPFPSHRPEATGTSGSSPQSVYIGHAQDGADGHELSDYDLVGSRKRGTGMFALRTVERFDLLYLPPPGKGRDVGPASLLAAEMYCRQRGAMLIVDPPADWTGPAAAVAGMQGLGVASANAIGYFPRMYRRDEDGPPRTVGGALAGLLCKLDRRHGPWAGLDRQGMEFQRGLVPALDVTEAEARILGRNGLNTIVTGTAGRGRLTGHWTMGRGRETHSRYADLNVRRTVLGVVNAIDKGTRWAVFERADEQLAARVRSQVTAYLAALAAMGAFENDRFDVHCDVGLRGPDGKRAPGFSIAISLQPFGCRQPVSFALHQSAAGCRVTTPAFVPVTDAAGADRNPTTSHAG